MKLDKWLMRQLQPEFFDSWKKIKASQEINISNSGALQSVLQMFPLSLWRGGFALHTQQPDCWLKSILFKIKALAQKRRSYSCNGQKSAWEDWSWWAQGRGGGNAAGWRRGHCQGALESCWGFFLAIFIHIQHPKVGGVLHIKTEKCPWQSKENMSANGHRAQGETENSL